MAYSHVACIHLLLMHGKFTGCMAVHFTDARKIYWMHGYPSSCIIRVHALLGTNSWPVYKNISMLISQSNCRDSLPHFTKAHGFEC